MPGVWGSTSTAWTTAESPWLPLSATAGAGCPEVAVAVHPATAVADCTVDVGTVAAVLAVPPAAVVFSGVWTPGAGTDDGHIRNTTYQNPYVLLFGRTATYVYEAFVRFPGVSIPQGADIVSAVWRRRAGYTLSDAGAAATLHCVDADDASAPTTTGEFTSLPLSAGTSWTDIASETTDQWYDSRDFAAEVQSVVDRDGWESGNAILLVLKNAVPSGTVGSRSGYAYDQGEGYASQLVVSWTTPATGDVTANVSTASLALAVHPAGATADVTSQASCPGLTLAVPPASVTCDVAAGVDAVSLDLAVLAAMARGDVAAAVSAPGLALAVLPATVDIPSGTVADVGTAGLTLTILPAAVAVDAVADVAAVPLSLAVHPATGVAVNPGDAVADVAAVALAVAIQAATVETIHIREWIMLRSPATLARALSGPASLSVALDAPANLTTCLRSPVDLRAG